MSEYANGKPPELRDAQGIIPPFGPMKRDEQGRALPITDEEQEARADSLRRVFACWAANPVEDEDPDELWEEVMRSIDAGRPEGFMKFEGRYRPRP